MMTSNPILEEIYAAREKLLTDAGGDVHKYLEGVRRREAASGRLLPPNPRSTSRASEAARSGDPAGQVPGCLPNSRAD